MEENKVETVENQENKTDEQVGGEIVIQQPGKLKKAIKWALAVVAGGALFVAGLITGKNSNNNEETTNDSAESESPEE